MVNSEQKSFSNSFFCLIFITFILTDGKSIDPIQDNQNFKSIEVNKDLEGSWEGEFQTPRRPVFITLNLVYDNNEEDWGGSVMVLGQTLPLHEVVPTDKGLKAVVIPGTSEFSLEVYPDADQLQGVVTDGGEQYPLKLKSVPEYTNPADREEAWQQDIEALTDRFLRYDYSFTPAEKELFREEIENLDKQISELKDSEIIVRMASAVALSDNAHTRLYLLRNRTELRRLPIRIWWFSDGLYVVRTTSTNRNFLGCRVDEIEGEPVHHVREQVSNAFAGNSSWTDYKSVYYMTSPEILHGFGIASDPENIEFSFSECKSNRFNHTFSALPLIRSGDSIEAWWDLSPNHSQEDWIQILDDSDVTVPLYLRHPNRYYWFEYIEKEKLLYFQYNRASEIADEGITSFGERLLNELDKKPVHTLVIDLRFNTGGNLGLAEDLMTKLQQRSKDMYRFVITGRAIFSAGITHVASWMEDGNVTLVGESVGDELDTWSEGGNIILPNSGLTAHFANAFHSYSKHPCPKNVPCFLDLNSPELRPDIPTSTTWTEYTTGIDAALDTVISAPR